jgi:diacylglycerol kinase (ATP)
MFRYQSMEERVFMNRYKLIVNPVSGRGAGEHAIPEIEHQMRLLNLEYDLVRTERPWHAAELAEEAAKTGFPVVVSVGGDGTANEVLNGLMKAKAVGADKTAMGILGVGRGNDFAFGVGIPHGFEAGCQALAKNVQRRIDVGKVIGGLFPQGRYFGNGVGIGFDAVVGFEALKLKRLKGFAGYAVAALKTIFLFFHAPTVEIITDNETAIMPSLMVSVMNGRRMGGGFMMAPQAEPDDGVFDLCIAGEVGKLKIFGLFPRFIKGTQEGHKAIKTGKTTKIAVTALEGVLPAHADGETLCVDGKKLTMEILPKQLDMVVKP